MKQIDALNLAIHLAGNKRQLAKKINVDPAAIYQWIEKSNKIDKKEDLVHYDYAAKIQIATLDRILARWLAPKCFSTIEKCLKREKVLNRKK